MSTKNIIAILIVLLSGMFYYYFVDPYKVEAIDTISEELLNLQTAYTNAQNQLSLQALKSKKDSLSIQEANILENFVPKKLHSGKFVYDLAQFANQNRLKIKSIQYSVNEDGSNNKTKRLQVEFTFEGRYEDFSAWLNSIEKANVLIDVDNIRGAKIPNSEIITFNVKLYAYGIQID
jgi:Tfp pilus assembly protein PilO